MPDGTDRREYEVYTRSPSGLLTFLDKVRTILLDYQHERILPGNILFDGQFVQGLKNGFANDMDCEGVLYSGQFSDGDKNGPGIIIYPHHRTFIAVKADFTKNLFKGSGLAIMRSGEIMDTHFHDSYLAIKPS